MSYDTVVVGAGLAGLTAALRLSERRQRVLIVARGVGATHLAPASVEVLGYLGDNQVVSPAASLPALSNGHPYGRVSVDLIASALAWFCEHTASLGYAGSINENMLLPTPLGVPKPSAFAPRSMAGGDLRAGGRFVFVGLRGFKDFHPALIADNLRHARLPHPIETRAFELDAPSSRIGDLSGRVIAGRFDTLDLAGWLVGALDGRTDPDERIGLPAMLGLRHGDAVWQDLEKRLQRRVFEVATLPPSLPGIRLYHVLTDALRVSGARIVLGVRAVGARAGAGRIEAVEVANATGTVTYPVTSVVLASGGFASGGLELELVRHNP